VNQRATDGEQRIISLRVPSPEPHAGVLVHRQFGDIRPALSPTMLSPVPRTRVFRHLPAALLSMRKSVCVRFVAAPHRVAPAPNPAVRKLAGPAAALIDQLRDAVVGRGR